MGNQPSIASCVRHSQRGEWQIMECTVGDNNYSLLSVIFGDAIQQKLAQTLDCGRVTCGSYRNGGVSFVSGQLVVNHANKFFELCTFGQFKTPDRVTCDGPGKTLSISQCIFNHYA